MNRMGALLRREGRIRDGQHPEHQAATMDLIAVHPHREGRIRDGQYPAHPAAIMDRIAVLPRREGRIRDAPCLARPVVVDTVAAHLPAALCQVRRVAAETMVVHRVADHMGATLEAEEDRTAALPVAAILRPGTTVAK